MNGERSAEWDARIVVRKSRDGHRFPWAATYPCCPFMNSKSGHGWPSWGGVMRQVERHLRELHPRAMPPGTPDVIPPGFVDGDTVLSEINDCLSGPDQP